MVVPASNPEPHRIHLDFAPPSVRRCVSSRFGTICFWIFLVLFLLLLAYLGLLAFTSYNGALQTTALREGPQAGALARGLATAVFGAAL